MHGSSGAATGAGFIQMCVRGGVGYLGGGLWRRSGLPACEPPRQGAGASPPQLALCRFLGRYELDQLDQQPLGQLPPPVWTQRLLPLRRGSGRGEVSQQPGAMRAEVKRSRAQTYRGIQAVDGVHQPGLLHSGPSGQNLWVLAGVPPGHIHHLGHRQPSHIRDAVHTGSGAAAD